MEKYLNFNEVSLISLSGDKWLVSNYTLFSIKRISTEQIEKFKKNEKYTNSVPLRKYEIIDWVFSKYGGLSEA